MFIFNIIDYLFVFIRYLCFGMGAVGIVGSVILALCNMSMGMNAVLLFVAAFLLSIALTLLLMPSKMVEKLPSGLMDKRWTISIVALVVATALTGIIYFTNGGFPTLNLIFMTIGG